MPGATPIDLPFPIAGLDRAQGYQRQPPYTTADCLNVRPRDVLERRERGGSRPGLSKAFPTRIGEGPVQMLAGVNIVPDDYLHTWTEEFHGETLDEDIWGRIGHSGALLDFPPIVDGAVQVLAGERLQGAARQPIVIDASQVYIIRMLVTRMHRLFNSGYYAIYGMLSHSNPTIYNQRGFVAGLRVLPRGSGYGGNLTAYENGQTVFSRDFATGPTGPVVDGWFVVTVENGAIGCSWRDEQLLAPVAIPLVGSTRIGFGLLCEGDYRGTDTVAAIDTIQLDYYKPISTVVDRPQSLLVASAGGHLYQEKKTGLEFEPVDTDFLLTPDRPIHAVQREQRLYIADPGEDGPAVYDPLTKELKRWTTENYPPDADPPLPGQPKGIVPTECSLICRFNDRLVLAGSQVWYMSRQGNPYDFDYSQTDTQAAVAGDASSSGQVGDNIIALIPHSDDFLIFGCFNSLWILRGDPGYQASLDNLSDKIGIVDSSAWCRSPSGETFILSADGLYMIPPGAGAYPTNLSRERLPKDLVHAEAPNFVTRLAYDVRYKGIHIFRLDDRPSHQNHYWFDLQTPGFWPVSLHRQHIPLSAVQYSGASTVNHGLLLGCHDGYIHRFRDTNADDDGIPFNSYVLYGPFRLGTDDLHAGILKEMAGTVAANSGAINWELLVGKTPKDALASSFRTGRWTEGLNYLVRPEASGKCFYLKLSNQEAVPWAVEAITVTRQPVGRMKVP